MTLQTLREFSAAGPCLTLGLKVGETPKFFLYYPWIAGRKVAAKVTRKGKRGTLVHDEPCPSCRDHPGTHYPNGYMD